MVTGYLSLVILLPLAAIAWHSVDNGMGSFWQAVSAPDAVAALQLTFLTSLAVAAINAVTGTLIAWVLVRDAFVGRSLVGAVIDLPFALPTIVAGLTLLSLYGPQSPVGFNAAYSRAGIVLALLFVMLPFVVRSVQPVLLELDREMEAAAASLGAGRAAIFRRIILPNLMPAILSGATLGFARSMGEFGSVVLISRNIPPRAAGVVAPAARRDAGHNRPRHPRPGRSDGGGRDHRRDEPRAHRAGGNTGLSLRPSGG
jgi:sulfate transport system permease protein